jgi:hypothetical protein
LDFISPISNIELFIPILGHFVIGMNFDIVYQIYKSDEN